MKILIIGAGPAGMMASISAKKQNNEVYLVEKNSEVGKKLNITGKGRCNITYVGNNEYFLFNVVSNPKFLISVINQFNNEDLLKYIHALGIKTKEERGNRVFLASDDARELTNALYKEVVKNGVKVLNNTAITKIVVKGGSITGAILQNGKELSVDRVIIATGGKSYPSTGSTGDGYSLAENLGHDIVKITPALVAFRLKEQNICKELEGLTLKNVGLKVVNALEGKDKILTEGFGELLFTKRGISGPIVLSASSDITKKINKEDNIKVLIDLKPALSYDTLLKRITRDFAKYINKEFKNSLGDILPSSLIPVIVEKSGINAEKKVNSITREEKENLAMLLKKLKFTFANLESVETGIVTSGGINVKEINPKTLESKKIQGLYFAGEVMDVDAYTGGFNLQIAFSTGFVSGKAAGGECE